MNLRNLSRVCYSNGFTLWHARTAEPLVIVQEPGYFDDAATMFNIGDMIMVSAIDGGMQVYVADIYGVDVSVQVMTATRMLEASL